MQRPEGTAWRAVVPSFAALVVAVLPGFLAAALAVQISEDIGLSLTELGLTVGAFFASSALTSPFMGRVVERVGWATASRAAALLAVPALGGAGLVAGSALGLAGFFAIGGVAAALAQLATNLAVSRCVAAERHGLLFGIKHVTIPVTTLLGGLAVPLVGLTVGWRWAFYGAASLAAVIAVLIPRDGRVFEVAPVAGTAFGDGERAAPDTPVGLLVILAVAAGLGIAANDAVASFIVVYGVDTGLSPASAGALLILGSIGAIVTRLVAGWAIDRRKRADLTVVAIMLVLGAVAVTAIAWGTVPALIAGATGAFVAGWGWSGLFTFAVVSDNPSAPAAATGVTHTGIFVGAALGPPAFGFVAEQSSFSIAWSLTGAALLVSAGLVLYARLRLRGQGPLAAPDVTDPGATIPAGGDGS